MDKPSPNKKIKISPESDASETSTNTTLTAVEASVEQRLPSTTPSVKNDVKRVAFMETNKEQSVPSKKEPRLAMKKMVLNDFKSYAGRQVIGPFHKVRFINCIYVKTHYFIIYSPLVPVTRKKRV